jgi:hypothetical protein
MSCPEDTLSSCAKTKIHSKHIPQKQSSFHLPLHKFVAAPSRFGSPRPKFTSQPSARG